MRPFTTTISLDEARAIVDAHGRPIDRKEILPLHEAGGRVVAGDVTSTVDVPPFPRASMDGYAVRAEDTAGASRQAPRVLTCVDTVFTGQVTATAVGAGECIQIATGAPMPAGADAVVIVEETESAASSAIRVFGAVQPRQNIGRQAADFTVGQIVLRDGDYLSPARVGTLAAIGLTEVNVYARPRVAILSTGNEIVEPGAALEPGQIYDINRSTLTAIVAAHGGSPEPHRTAGDELDELTDAIDECLEADIVVFSGGSSVGERDLMLDAMARKGQVLFHGISIKPGKPTAFGIVNGKPMFGMPGYPTSCLTNAYILLVPLLRRVARLPPDRARTATARLGQRIVSAAGRHQFYTVRLEGDVAHPAFKASGDITSMSLADGYVEIASEVDVLEEGTTVEVKLF